MTTASDSQVREGRQEGNSPAGVPGPPGADAHVRANSLTLPDSIAFEAVTQSARAVFRGSVSVLAALDRAGSLPDAQPPTFRQARAEHHRCAGHYRSPVLRLPRLLWGYIHLLAVKPALNGLEWVTASPARSVAAAAVLAALWFGGLR